MSGKSKQNPFSIDYTKAKDDFGIEKSVGSRDSATTNLNLAIEKVMQPAGILESNKEFTGVVLAKNLNTIDTKVNNYHIYVPMVHQSRQMPLALKSNNSPLSAAEALKAYPLEVMSNFSDETSYMTSDIDGDLAEGDVVTIVYSDVNSGVPAKGRIKEKQDRKIEPDDALKLFQLNMPIPTQPAGGKGHSGRVPVPTKVPAVVMSTAKAKEIAKNTKCKLALQRVIIWKKTTGLKYYLNYDGIGRHFSVKCDKYQSCLKEAKNLIKATSAPGRAVNLLDRNNLGANMKHLLDTTVEGTPYWLAGRGIYTPAYAYDIAQNIKYGKRYQEKQSRYKFRSDGTLESTSYDCAGLLTYLCFRLGFLAGIRDEDYTRVLGAHGHRKTVFYRNDPTKPRWWIYAALSPFTQQTNCLPLNIEQWAKTPGAGGFPQNKTNGRIPPTGHTYVSAGRGFTVEKDEKTGEKIYVVPVWEASLWWLKNGLRTFYFVERNGKIYRRRWWKKKKKWYFQSTPEFLGVLKASLYADYMNDFDPILESTTSQAAKNSLTKSQQKAATTKKAPSSKPASSQSSTTSAKDATGDSKDAAGAGIATRRDHRKLQS